MITELFLGNYRSLGRWNEISLDPLTVLVGINGSGKSNVADALRFIGDAVRDGLEHAVASRQGFGSLRRWSRGGRFDVTLAIDVRLGEVDWLWAVVLTGNRTAEFCVKHEIASAHSKSLSRDKVIQNIAQATVSTSQEGELELDWEESSPGGYHFHQGTWKVLPHPDLKFTPAPRSLILPELAKLDPRFQPLADHLAGLTVYSLFPPTLRLPQASDPTQPMRRQGENWATHLRALDRNTQGAELLAALGRVVGDIDDYKVSAVGGFLIPEFRHGKDGDRERWFGASQESDGTLRMAGILTALLQSPSPSLIGIEEPELAVHPGALPLLVDYMKQASTHTQVIVTSHSPELLDLVDPESLRVVERSSEGTMVSSLAREQLDTIRKKLCSTSDLLRAEGLLGEGQHD